MPETHRTEADAIAEIVMNAERPQMSKATGTILDNNQIIPNVIFPKNGSIHSIEKFLAHPVRKRATVTVKDQKSFIDYVSMHRQRGTLVFCNITETGGSVTAIIDYHDPHQEKDAHLNPANVVEGYGRPNWGDHKITLEAQHTPEWRRWNEVSGKWQTQEALAQFIEDNRIDITEPDGGRILDIVKSLEAAQGGEFQSAVRLDNGDRKLSYVRKTTAKAGPNGEFEIPDHFKIQIPVFSNGTAYEVVVRFRYKIDGGVLGLRLELVRPHKVVEAAMVHTVEAISEGLKTSILLGVATLPTS